MTGRRLRAAFGWLGAAILGAVCLVALGARGEVAAEDKGPAKAGSLPPDLERVPRAALGLFSIRVADLWDSELGKAVRTKGAKEAAEAAKHFEKELGVAPGQIERLTLVLVAGPEETALLVSTRKPYDKAKVLAGFVPGAREEKYKGETIYVGMRDRGAYFVNPSVFVVGREQEVRLFVGKPEAGGDEGLGGAMKLAAKKHLAVLGLNMVVAARLAAAEELPPQMAPFKPLLKARAATLTFDLGDKVRADLRVAFGSEADAKAGEKALQVALKMGQGILGQGIKELTEQKAPAEVVGLLRKVDAALKGSPLKRSGTAVVGAAEVRIDPATLGAVAVQGVQQARAAAARAQAQNNLKQIGVAMHNYHDTFGAFPPAAIYNKDGKALLSWRVLILPFVEQDALYKEFRLNEAWDSPHNKKLLAKMPKLYEMPAQKAPPHSTYYQVFAGPGSVFEGKRGIRLTDITDGTSNTIMVVEAGKAVPWTKPEDIPYVPGKPVPKVGGPRGGGFNALFCDGSVRYFAKPPKDATFHAYITRAGGEVINDE
jgi:prepilin-type processing-associated H-X9-DG protein